MVHQGFTHDRPGTHDEVEDARRKPGAGQDLREHPGAAGGPLRRLEHDGVAERQRGRDLPRRNGDRKIPGGDESHDADRLACDFDLHARTNRGQFLPRQAKRFPGKKLEDVSGADGLTDTFRQGLPFLAREQPAQLVLAGKDVRASLVEDVGAILNRADRPRHCRALGRLHRRIRLFGVGLRVLADHVGEIRRVPVGCP